MAQTADLILDEYYNLNIYVIKLCFNMSKSGKFGKVYDRIDGQVIMGWLSEYEAQRIEICEHNNEAKHQSRRANR